MLQKRPIDQVFYPGSQWVYFRIYMGPAAADQWICQALPQLYQRLDDRGPDFRLFFVRFMDPDFHIRLRIYSEKEDMLGFSLRLLQEISDRWQQTGYLWKVEIGTYEREINRYSLDLVEAFEQVFCADSRFWTESLAKLSNYESFENLRWKAGLASMLRYFNDLSISESNSLQIVDSVMRSLNSEIGPNRSFNYRLDQKYRQLSDELILLVREEHPINNLINRELDRRTNLVKSVFSDSPEDAGVSDLIHMSLNRCLRSKHRVQEYVLYYFLNKLLRRRQALR